MQRLPVDRPPGSVLTYRGDQRMDRSDKVATAAGGAEHYVCTPHERIV